MVFVSRRWPLLATLAIATLVSSTLRVLDILLFFSSLLDRDIFRLVSFPAVCLTSPQRNNYPRLDCLLMDWYYPAGELGYVASEPTGGSTNGVLRPCPRSALDM